MTSVSNSELAENDGNDLSQEPEEEKSEKLLKLPIARVKHIMKMDPDVNLASQEAVFLIAKSTELFIESLSREAYTYTAQAKRKTLQKKDIDSAVDSVDSLAFLEGALDF
ncbi:DNA polymerase epsilon subunit 4 [Anabrus simplex]|uniref:DNA polymerase epsilon subunit 4 n=1 Tax=Anabrus simplex TaxID=316456 RepID=UPI0034DD88E6